MQLAAESIIEVGRELIEQKKALGHGNFLPWIEAEFGMSDDTAQNLMRIHTEYGANTERVRHLSYRALIALSSKSTPPEVRTEVEARSSKGEKVTAVRNEPRGPPSRPARYKLIEHAWAPRRDCSRAKKVKAASIRVQFLVLVSFTVAGLVP
jgi:hypothetical protein